MIFLPKLQLSWASSHRETTLMIARPASCTQTAIATFLSPCSCEICCTSSSLYGGLMFLHTLLYEESQLTRECEFLEFVSKISTNLRTFVERNNYPGSNFSYSIFIVIAKRTFYKFQLNGCYSSYKFYTCW